MQCQPLFKTGQLENWILGGNTLSTAERPHRFHYIFHFCLCFISSIKLVFGSSWTTLASSCPDLKVKLSVDQIINTNRLARILLPEIPLSKYHMTAFYSPEAEWSPRPLLSDILPQYRRRLEVCRAIHMSCPRVFPASCPTGSCLPQL